MSIPSLSYSEHAMIYSAALLIVGCFIRHRVPVLSVTLCESMYRPLIVLLWTQAQAKSQPDGTA